MKFLPYIVGFTLCSVLTQAQAGPTIEEFIDNETSEAYFNCAYKGKKASKKCLVTQSYTKSNSHPLLNQIYGSNEVLPLMTIKWPDGDTSRYVYMDSFELGNLNGKELGGLSFKTIDDSRGWRLDLSNGLIIESSSTGNEHIRLW